VKKGRLIAIGLSLAVVVGVFAFVLPRIADYRAVWDTIQELTWQQGVALLIAEVANLATFGPPLMASLPGIGYWRAVEAESPAALSRAAAAVRLGTPSLRKTCSRCLATVAGAIPSSNPIASFS
jgi:hypothetical protein